jgi:hypothetical protein
MAATIGTRCFSGVRLAHVAYLVPPRENGKKHFITERHAASGYGAGGGGNNDKTTKIHRYSSFFVPVYVGDVAGRGTARPTRLRALLPYSPL